MNDNGIKLENGEKKEKSKIYRGRKAIIMIIVPLLFISIFLSYNIIKNKNAEAMEFPDNIAMYITKDEPITIGEYLIYAASVSQEATEIYGEDVWNQAIEVNNGDYVTFEEYTRQQICEQIKLTHILSAVANTYNVTLSQEESVALSEDAEVYHKSLAEFDSGNVGIDLALILKVYKENLVAEKVYNEIISNVKKTDEMFNDEYEEACINYFEKEYKKISKIQAKNWSYDTHVNIGKLSKIELAKTSLSEDEEVTEEKENQESIILDSLVGMD